MRQSSSVDYTHQLRSLMQPMGVSSFKALSQAAGVSEWQVRQLRQGKASLMRVKPLLKLGQVLQISLEDLIRQFSDPSLAASFFEPKSLDSPPAEAPSPESVEQEPPDQPTAETLQREYQRLQAQLAQQRERLLQEFQQASVQTLESWLIQFPTAAYAAQQNPQVPASRLLPLMRPVEQLLRTWNIEAIAPVGAEVPYDPQQHQLMDGTAQPGDQVRVRYTGYRQGDKLLFRAKVSPVAPSSS